MCFAKIKKSKGFTLVELLVVVIILAVLASIVVPQFSSSTDDAKEAALKSTVSGLRNAIELYYHQHGATYPGRLTDGTNAANTDDSFVAQLTLYTDASGDVSNTTDATHIYGPYLKKAAFPTNPVDTGTTGTDILIVVTGSLAATGTDAGGWWFDTVSGKLLPNIAGYYTY